MPLFMDRHDVPGATARDIAEAHLKDLEVAAKHDVRFLSYWFDDETGSAFCFAEAPATENMQSVHQESHGLVANEVLAVSEADVLQFLGRVRHPRDHTEVTSPFRTIMFTDLVDSTALLESVGEERFMPLLDEHDRIVRRALVAWRGREVKHTGDGIMASFDDVTDALASGCAIRDGFAREPDHESAVRMEVRVGMAAGQPVDRNNDLFGSAVVRASRICNAAAGGQVLVSAEVHDEGVGADVLFGDPLSYAVKGFGEPVTVFELLSVGSARA